MATSSDFRFITQFDVSSHCSRKRVTVEGNLVRGNLKFNCATMNKNNINQCYKAEFRNENRNEKVIELIKQ